MSILPFVNLKGGVAKTTIAVAVAESLATTGYRVLLIDADHQCMSGELLLGEQRYLKCERDERTLHDLLVEMTKSGFHEDLVQSCVIAGASNISGGLDRLSVIPSSIRIDGLATTMAKARQGHRSAEAFQHALRQSRAQLRTWLNRRFDFTIVDCPPSSTLQVRYFLAIGDAFVLPTIPDRLSVRGAFLLMDRLKRHGLSIPGLGTIWSLYRKQNSMHRRIVDGCAQGHPVLRKLPQPFETIIPNAARIAQACEWGRRPSTLNAKYSSEFAGGFRSLCKEIVKRSQWPEMRRPELAARQ